MHRENSPMNRAPRCGARTRSGEPRRSAAVHGGRGVGCMVVLLGAVRVPGTRAPSNTALTPPRWLQNGGSFGVS